jgi:P-type Cu2+ transporter
MAQEEKHQAGDAQVLHGKNGRVKPEDAQQGHTGSHEQAAGSTQHEPAGHAMHDRHDAGPHGGDAPQMAAQAGHTMHGGAAGQPEAGGHAMSQAGHADAHTGHVDHTGHEQMFRQRFWVCLVLSIPVLLYSPMLQEWFHFSMPALGAFTPWFGPLFAVIIFLYGGVPFLQMAVPELRSRKPGMMTLISLAISVAFLYSVAAVFIDPMGGFFWELVTLIDIMLLGHWIEMRSVRQASGALDELARLMPDTAERIRPEGGVETVPVDLLRTGDLVLVRPGASVPVDGTVAEGESDVNEAMLTGESRPVKKRPGDAAIAGTTNGDGSLRLRVTATGDETALAGIMRLVRDAQQSKSRTQLLADRAAAWLFYIALAVAALTAVAWGIAIGLNVEVIARVATVLVIACPHALGLAIPLVVAITTTLAAQNGVLVRDRLALEKAREIDMVVFDKTGTLTRGEFGVTGVKTMPGWDDDRALALAAAVEGDSEHIMAQAVRRTARERGLALAAVTGFEALKGRGAHATSAGRDIYVGGPRLLELLNLTLAPELAAFAGLAGEQGQSVIYLVHDGEPVAAFALADVVRPESKQAVQRLHDMGVQVAMLTGDSEAVARAVAAELGIDRYFAQVLPEHKDQKITELQRQGQKVAMVGDGVNDAPALTRADVGIAIGSGTDVAIESAGIILVKSNPLDVVKVIELSRASYRKMAQNLAWATGYNVIALPLAAGVLAPFGILLSPAVGALFMSLSTVVVAINAQLLRRVRV